MDRTRDGGYRMDIRHEKERKKGVRDATHFLVFSALWWMALDNGERGIGHELGQRTKRLEGDSCEVEAKGPCVIQYIYSAD